MEVGHIPEALPWNCFCFPLQRQSWALGRQGGCPPLWSVWFLFCFTKRRRTGWRGTLGISYTPSAVGRWESGCTRTREPSGRLEEVACSGWGPRSIHGEEAQAHTVADSVNSGRSSKPRKILHIYLQNCSSCRHSFGWSFNYSYLPKLEVSVSYSSLNPRYLEWDTEVTQEMLVEEVI